MTLFDIISATKERFPNAESKEVCRIVNELEGRLIDEIFSPHNITVRTERLNAQTNMYTPLILKEEHILLYVYFVLSVFSLRELDFSAANAYSTAFNEKFSELAVYYRRNNIPVKNILLSGGI